LRIALDQRNSRLRLMLEQRACGGQPAHAAAYDDDVRPKR
jgi:hypothetical protein